MPAAWKLGGSRDARDHHRRAVSSHYRLMPVYCIWRSSAAPVCTVAGCCPACAPLRLPGNSTGDLRSATFRPLRRSLAGLRFAVPQLGGAAVNLGCYFLLIHTSTTVVHSSVIGAAAGPLLGLLVNLPALGPTYSVAPVAQEGGSGSLAPRRRSEQAVPRSRPTVAAWVPRARPRAGIPETPPPPAAMLPGRAKLPRPGCRSI